MGLVTLRLSKGDVKTYWIYILRCADGSYYTGVTNNIEARVGEHQGGLIPGCYTKSRRPVVLVFSEAFQDINDAIAAEKQVKGWSRKKKEALIRHDFKRLVGLSQRRGVMLREPQHDTALRDGK